MRKYIIDRVTYDPIKMGEAGDFDESCDSSHTCHDCKAKVHEEHSIGCDAERCPCCGGQIISCGCHITIKQINNKKSDFKERKKQNDEEM